MHAPFDPELWRRSLGGMSTANDSVEPMPHELGVGRLNRTCGLRVAIDGACGASHAPQMAAATTVAVLGVAVQPKPLSGLVSLSSAVQMPRGVPVWETL